MTAVFTVRVNVPDLERETILEIRRRLIEQKGVLSVEYNDWVTEQENQRPNIHPRPQG